MNLEEKYGYQSMKILIAILLFASVAAAQVCDSLTDDTAAIQTLLNAGGTVLLPEGICVVSGLVIQVDGTHLDGRGRTVLKRKPATYKSLLSLPREWSQHTGQTVKDVRISDIVLDGNRTGLQPAGQPNYFGLQIIQGARITIENVTVLDQFHDGISIGVGDQVPRNVLVSNSRVIRAQRNGIHIGFGDGVTLSGVFIDDTPSQQWAPASGNGIDVEVEGVNPYVHNFVIENSTIQRFHTPGAGTAGTGIALQPAFGRIRYGFIRGNTIRNHAVGILLTNDPTLDDGVTASVDSITLESNRVLMDAVWVDDSGIQLYGPSNVKVINNDVNALAGPASHVGSIQIWGGRNYTIEDNRLVARYAYRPSFCNVQIRDLPTGTHRFTTNATLRRNGYNAPCFLHTSPNAVNVGSIENHIW